MQRFAVPFGVSISSIFLGIAHLVGLLAPPISIPANTLVSVTGRVKGALRSSSKLYGGMSTSFYLESLRSGAGAPAGSEPSVVTALSSPPPRALAAPFAGGMTITAAADNGSGKIRLTVDSTAKAVTGNAATISGLTTCTEANGTWAFDIVDSTHLDLRGSALVHAGADSGTALLLGCISAGFTGNALQLYARGLKPPKWLQSEAVVAGDVRWNATANQTVVYTASGTTSGSGTGPTGTGTGITDGGATCDFLVAGRSCPLVWLVTELRVEQL